MSTIKDEIDRGTYQVDPKAVADAILRRLDLGLIAPKAASIRTNAPSR